MSKFKKLILQFKIKNHGNIDDLNKLIGIEVKLEAALQRNDNGYVDGHDMGSCQMNIFIFVKTWKHGLRFYGTVPEKSTMGKRQNISENESR